jgi:DNA-binding LacI/PurR family transcriptional regulator
MRKEEGKNVATLKDVARLAGVSISTASFSLNGGAKVREETRRRIDQAAATLHYVPNASARSLVTQKNLVIGVIRCTDKLDDSFYAFDTTIDTYLSEMLKSIEQESVRFGYSLMVDWANTHDNGSHLSSLYETGKVDGILMVGGIVEEGLPARLKERQIPTVMVGSRNEYFDYVDTDYAKAMMMAVEYLVKNGHRKIAFLGGPDTSQTSAIKLKGFRKAMDDASLEVREDWLGKGDFSGLAGYEAMKGIWEKGGRPTAIVAAVDCIGLGALRYLHEQKVYCPDDISLVGYEDGLLAEYSIPPLTTVSSEKQLLGKEACRILIDRIKSPDTPLEQIIVNPVLKVRESVRKA